jgi:TPR repeat protein
MCLHLGIGVEIDVNGAVDYYRRIVGLDSTTAAREDAGRLALASSERMATLFLFGRCLEFGCGIPQDPNRAADCYQLSAEHGVSLAQVALGVFCEHGGSPNGFLLVVDILVKLNHPCVVRIL